ncbi:MAG: F0F1 ATP synthase subunit gamma [Akkermansiaceae bacterium]|nr:F0F1 ATP synthase subunit gamma [Akkermansiaceae bacterium]
MPDSLPILRRRIRNVEDLRAVVKSMKAMSAASITQFEQAANAVAEAQRAVERALSVCLRGPGAPEPPATRPAASTRRGFVVFGGDQGMAGQFNEHAAEAAREHLAAAPATTRFWTVGERVQSRLEDAGHRPAKHFPAPQSIEAASPLVSELLLEIENAFLAGEVDRVDLCHNAPVSRAHYETRWTRLLPLDEAWRETLRRTPWPGRALPEMIECGSKPWTALVSEYLFVALYRVCAESGAAENAARRCGWGCRAGRARRRGRAVAGRRRGRCRAGNCRNTCRRRRR